MTGQDDEEDRGQRAVLAVGHDHAADGHDRGADHHGQREQDDLLHLLDVVGVAGDQARRAEVVELDLAERLDLAEDRRAHVAPEAHGDLGREVDGDERRDHQRERHAEHEAAGLDDVVDVARDHTVVDDVRVELGQVQVGDRLDELQHHHERDGGAVRPQVLPQDGDHRWVSWVSGSGAGREAFRDRFVEAGRACVPRARRIARVPTRKAAAPRR